MKSFHYIWKPQITKLLTKTFYTTASYINAIYQVGESHLTFKTASHGDGADSKAFKAFMRDKLIIFHHKAIAEFKCGSFSPAN